MKKHLKLIVMDSRTKEFLQRNISTEPYELLRLHLLEIYPSVIIDWESVPLSIWKQAKQDLAIFDKIQEARAKSNAPQIGDHIRRKNGSLTKIGIFIGDKLQDTHGGSFHVTTSGGSYSGGFTMDMIDINCLQNTGETAPLNCWIFSGDLPGGNRGVHDSINTKIWKEND